MQYRSWVVVPSCLTGCLGRFDDNLLQYILESTCRPVPYEHTEAEGRLSIALAKKYTLEELCHQSSDGYDALFYAERVAHEIEDRWPVNAPDGLGIWVQLRDVMRERLQACAREFQGTLCELAALTESVRLALGGQSLPALDEQLWRRASVVRQQWCIVWRGESSKLLRPVRTPTRPCSRVMRWLRF